MEREKIGEILLLLGLILIVQLIEYNGWFAAIDGRFLNARVTQARVEGRQESQDAVYLLNIDDDTYKTCFCERSPLDPRKVETIVREVAQSAPAIIGVDILTDAEAYKSEYAHMAKSLDKQPSRIIWTAGIEPGATSNRTANFAEWLFGKESEYVVKPTPVLGVAPAELRGRGIDWGLPVYPQEEDLQVRGFPRCIALSADPGDSSRVVWRKSWARLVAELYSRGDECKDKRAEEVYLNFSTRTPETYAVRELFDCSAGKISRRSRGGEAFWSTIHNKIVLIGGTFQSSRDFYVTPKGSLSGLEINAYAVQSEIDGSEFREIKQPWAMLLDLVVGLLTLWVVSLDTFRTWLANLRIRWLANSHQFRLFIVLSVVVWSLIIFGVWHFAGSYVMTVAGVVFGILLHSFVGAVRKMHGLPETPGTSD